MVSDMKINVNDYFLLAQDFFLEALLPGFKVKKFLPFHFVSPMTVSV